MTENGETKIVIGYASIASNRVTIPVETTKQTDIEPISFQCKYVRINLKSNKDCEKATLEVSSAGLSRIKFSVDNYDSEYFLVSTQLINGIIKTLTYGLKSIDRTPYKLILVMTI